MKLKKLLQPICAGLLSAIIIAGSAGVSAENVATDTKNAIVADSSALFTKTVTADFSGLPNGAVDDSDTETVKYLKDRFTFYAFQMQPGSNWNDIPLNNYFERTRVNGYLGKESGDRTRMPDTAAFPNIVFDGWDEANGTTTTDMPTWTVDGKWLYCTAKSDADTPLFRQVNLMYIADNTPTTLANIKDFNLEMNFKFHSLSEKVADGTDNLAILFEANSAGYVFDGDQLMFMVAPDGQYKLGRVNWNIVPSYDGSFTDVNGDNVTFERDKEYHLSMTVVGQQVSIVISDENGVVAGVEKTVPMIQNGVGGYIAITGSNSGAKYADIALTRLNGYSFSVAAHGLADYRRLYMSNDIPAGSQFWNNTLFREPGSERYWSNYWGANEYRFSGDDIVLFANQKTQPVTDYMNQYFNLYHEGYNIQTHYFAKASSFSNHHGQCGMTFESPWSGWMKWHPSNDESASLMAYMGDIPYIGNEEISQSNYAQSISLAPKTSDGAAFQTKNFETAFKAKLYNNGAERAIALSFRSQAEGTLLSDSNKDSYANKTTLLFNGAGYALIDNEDLPMTSISFNPWNGSEVVDDLNADIYVKAVGTELTVQVTKPDGTVLLDTVMPISDSESGFLYYSAYNMHGFFYEFNCNRLDALGRQIDWDGKTVSYSIGDVNGDEAVDVRDLVAFKKYLTDIKMDYFVEDAADLDGSGKVDAADIIILRKYLLGIIEL